jgi:hypothetical protein
MGPILIIGIGGLLGGLVLALLIFRFQHPSEQASETSSPQLMSPMNAINMARIRVNGIGGLGMVAMATVVAIFVPRIRETMALALVLGVLFAVILIARRRRTGPLPSSGGRPGANTALSIDDPWPVEERKRRDPSSSHELSPAVLG